MTEFREILVLGSGRSGSNLLCSMLSHISGNASFYEVLIADRIPIPKHYGAVIRGLLDFYKISGERLEAPDMLRARDEDPVAFYEALAVATRNAGHRSMSCKIFSHQISLDHLDVLLRRPNLCVIFLTRRRIDRHISAIKGKITNLYARTDTTEVRPDLKLSEFLRHGFKLDNELEAMHDRATTSGVRIGYLTYESDLDIEPKSRQERISLVLQSLDLPSVNQDSIQDEFYVKQDSNVDWRNKIENGFEVSAALAGLGLIDWAETSPLIRHYGSPSPYAKPAAVAQDETLLDCYSNFHVLSTEPLITFSAIDNDRSYLAEWMGQSPSLFQLRRGLHFVKPTWNMETSNLGPLLETFRRAERTNPGHRFVVLHASEIEADRYRGARQPSIACNGAVFINEENFTVDAEPFSGLVSTEALYIARFAHWKNHHLAAELDRPLFVYAEPKKDEALRYDEMRRVCSTAQFVNHLTDNGTYRYFNRQELNSIMSRARVSLALSTNEGFMRGSIESLLAGLPVLSVKASGGRDAFYMADTALIVEPTAAAVKAGVAELTSHRVSRSEVRRVTLSLLSQARHSFLENANKLAHGEFGPLAPQIKLEPLLDFVVRYSTLRKALELME